MKKLNVDSGVQEFAMPCGVLRMNPCDVNVYSRFLEAAERIAQLQQQLCDDAERGQPLAELMCSTDRQIKQQLTAAFGQENDFDRLLGGVNVFAPGRNGQSVLVNLFAALQSVLEEGVRRWTDGKVAEAVEISKRRKKACV